MKLFFQKDALIDHIKKLIQLLIRIKDFVLEPPPGYLEYQKAITSGLGSNGTANRLKAFLLFLMALTHHVLPHLAWQRNIVRAY